ncbi:MAG: endolytic transglycosylase MltG [Oligoflexia bacterium]|jgi:UPF0755 protein
MRSALRWIFGGIPLVLVGAAGIWGLPLALFALRPVGPPGVQPTEAYILVTRGATPSAVLQEIEKSGFEIDRTLMHRLGRLQRTWQNLKTGEYKISSSQTPWQILKTLTSGISVTRSLTIREGENMYEIAARMEQAGLAPKTRVLELCRNPAFIQKQFSRSSFAPPTLEGFLFPDTYSFNRLQTPEEMLEQMLKRYRQVWGEIQKKPRLVQTLTEFQVITLASIIEKETGAPEERPLISSVFHNRLKKKMRLQSDPTTIYGIWDRYDGNIRRSDLTTATPYNTYTVAALPAGPISNPGSLAIEAALNPSVSDYLYFVSRNDGRHVFTRTYHEHKMAVGDFQLNKTAREGKSWRDLRRTSQQN